MKLSGRYIERTFFYKNFKFVSTEIENNSSGEKINLKNENEFIIYFMDGTTLESSQMNAYVIKSDENNIIVDFLHYRINVKVEFYFEKDVLYKSLTLGKCDEEINYIDTEIIDFTNKDNLYYPKKQEDIEEMADFAGYYVELGQPIYAKSLFLGMEFPLGENRLYETKYFSRYYLGKPISKCMNIWPTVIGGASNVTRKEIQKTFYQYISQIACGNYFRKQYNSWYDHMKDIDEGKILKSFKEINQGFAKNNITLDSYVVDDGWVDYQSMWKFNDKFPNGLSEISKLTKKLDSALGFWIGPRGGYGGTEVIMSDWLEQNENKNLGSKNHKTNDVNVGDYKYLINLKEVMLNYQIEYDINYWKIDGLLIEPEQNDKSGSFGMHTMIEVYEFMIDLFVTLRKERESKGEDLWLNLTSYVNPSPWFLKWVNSLWIQNSQDVGFSGENGSDLDRMMTYRDSKYYEFLNKREIQLPLWSLYNHEPIYAATAHRGYFSKKMSATDEEFEKYLYFIATRGNGFWEFHYSYHMLNENKWRINGEVVKWIQDNYYILRNSTFFGSEPTENGIYGYLCENEKENKKIISFRNPTNILQKTTIDVLSNEKFEVIYGNWKGENIKDKLFVELEPYEVLILKKK